MPSPRIVFMGTPKISSVYLKSLIDARKNIVAVYSQPPRKKGRGMSLKESPVLQLAKKNIIKVLTPTEFFSTINTKDLKELQPDLIVAMGYGLKLPKHILQLPTFGCINIHVSLLPRWRGAAPIEHTLLNGDKETGITIFKIVDEMDAGPILIQKTLVVDQDINKEELTEKLNYIGTMCVEYFIDENDNLLVNEIAPRVHNSGHLTINAYNVSQFENHIRAICNLKKVELKKIHNAEMINIIGKEIENYRKKFFNDREFFFDYGKKVVKDKRKMGHLTILER